MLGLAHVYVRDLLDLIKKYGKSLQKKGFWSSEERPLSA
jgi:hypothetical protein